MAEVRWTKKRRDPYTASGIRRRACVRCGRPGEHQWRICSDGGHYRPLCVRCDVALNRLVLRWSRHPRAKALGDAYAAKQALIHG